jgi:hypothetical protein
MNRDWLGLAILTLATLALCGVVVSMVLSEINEWHDRKRKRDGK